MRERKRLPAIRFTLNRRAVTVRAHPMTRLLDVLRNECGLTGTKEGCGEGECGACTVLVDGAAVNACLVPVAQVAACKVRTIEGLGGRHPLQRAFVSEGGAQCGICTPGMILAAVALGPNPSIEDIRRGLAGNLCRCTGYEGIYRSIRKAAQTARRRGAMATTATRTSKSAVKPAAKSTTGTASKPATRRGTKR